MENLLISGETSEIKSWDIDEILPRQRSVKDDFDRMLFMDRMLKDERRMIYDKFYLDLEYRKKI